MSWKLASDFSFLVQILLFSPSLLSSALTEKKQFYKLFKAFKPDMRPRLRRPLC